MGSIDRPPAVGMLHVVGDSAGQDDNGNAPEEGRAGRRATGATRGHRQRPCRRRRRRPGTRTRPLWFGASETRSSGAQGRSGGQASGGRTDGRAGHPGGTGATRPKAATPPQRGWSPRPRSPAQGSGSSPHSALRRRGVNTAPNGDVIWAKEPPNQGDPGSAARRIRIVHGAPVDSRRLGAWPSSAQGGCPPKVLTAPGQAPDQVLTPHKTGTPPDSPVADKPSGRLRTFPLD
jgi:hypothetical protein